MFTVIQKTNLHFFIWHAYQAEEQIIALTFIIGTIAILMKHNWKSYDTTNSYKNNYDDIWTILLVQIPVEKMHYSVLEI